MPRNGMAPLQRWAAARCGFACGGGCRAGSRAMAAAVTALWPYALHGAAASLQQDLVQQRPQPELAAGCAPRSQASPSFPNPLPAPCLSPRRAGSGSIASGGPPPPRTPAREPRSSFPPAPAGHVARVEPCLLVWGLPRHVAAAALLQATGAREAWLLDGPGGDEGCLTFESVQ